MFAAESAVRALRQAQLYSNQSQYVFPR